MNFGIIDHLTELYREMKLVGLEAWWTSIAGYGRGYENIPASVRNRTPVAHPSAFCIYVFRMILTADSDYFLKQR
jgi:hypothetical protein